MKLFWTCVFIVTVILSWKPGKAGPLKCYKCSFDEFDPSAPPADGLCERGRDELPDSYLTTVSDPNDGPHEYCAYESWFDRNHSDAGKNKLKLKRYKYSTAEKQKSEFWMHRFSECEQRDKIDALVRCHWDKCNHDGWTEHGRAGSENKSGSSMLTSQFHVNCTELSLLALLTFVIRAGIALGSG